VAQQTKSKSDRKRSSSGNRKRSNSGSGDRSNSQESGKGRNKSPTPKKERAAKEQGDEAQAGIRNQGGKKTRPEQMYEDYTVIDPVEISDTDEPDVIVDVPVLKVDEIHFELDDLMARVSLHAEVLDLVKLSVGVHAELGKVELNIKGVEAQALMRARLDHVTAIIDRVLTTLDRNPDVLNNITKALQPVTEGAGKAVGEVGEGANKAVGQIGEGAGSAVEDVGEGAGGAVKDVGKGAGSAVEDVGEGAGGAVEDVGEGAGGAVKDVGKGAGGAVEEVGEGANKAVGEVGKGAGQAAGGLGEGAGEAVGGLGQGAGALGALAGAGGGGGGGGGNGGEGNGGGNGGGGGAGGGIAKQIAKIVAAEIKAAATDEVKDIGMGAAHKAMEIGEKRRQKRAQKHNATEAAMRKAQDAGVDIDDVEGTGAEGRVTVHDVEKAAAAA